MNCSDSGFCSVGGEIMNVDNIFFYEDNLTSSQDRMPIAYKTDDHAVSSMDTNDQSDTLVDMDNSINIPKNNKRQKDSKFTQIKVNVGIDEDLKMILDMDPSLIDGVLEKAVEPAIHNQKISGLPPKM